MEKSYTPLSFYLKEFNEKFALIVLNTPISKNDKLIEKLLKQSSYKVYVDGAANRIFDAQSQELKLSIPNLITGDFDSARSDVLDFYKEKGVEIIETPDQNFTDFTKCIRIILDRIGKNEINAKYILVHVGVSGRFDQVIGNIQTLFHIVPNTNIPIYLISDENITFLLEKGCHKIMLNDNFSDGYCGLIPIGRPCRNVTTKGLKWNLEHNELEFGRLVSTSNVWNSDSKFINIETDEALIFTMSLKEFL